MKRLRAVGLALLALCLPLLASAAPVEFSFRIEAAAGNPFAREIWAEVVTPAGATLRLPAFFAGNDTWAVRTRAAAVGEYRLGPVAETTAAGVVAVAAQGLGATEYAVRTVDDPHGNVVIDPRNPRRFALADGTPYVPFGMNLAWATGQRDSFYPDAFAKLEQAGLNWSRVWMCHWGGANLDWLPDDMGPSPAPGTLDLRVAKFWDTIVDAAEAHGIRFQMVFQHHGQISTGANANWEFNPWNTANGGFLSSPVAFFSNARARAITRQKFRYIVARWGYSSAVMAWELFNEAMWTDARNGTAADNAAIGAWHAEMAAYVRSIDVHHHLVTTSDDYLDQPLYAKMDYYQPHLYACHLLPSARFFDRGAAELDRPIFYGEAGEDNEPRLAGSPRQGGVLTLPIIWSSTMGDAAAPAQYWYTWEAIGHGILPQFATLARFRRETGLDRRADLEAFTAVVESAEQIPLTIEPALNWHQCQGPTIAVPLDGREVPGLAANPRHFVSADPAAHQKYPGRATYLLDYPHAATATVRVAGHGRDGASFRLVLDGVKLDERIWPPTADGQADTEATEFPLTMTAGRHSLTIENPFGKDWFELGGIDTGLTCSPLAAAGKRADDRVCLWVWHRQGVYSEAGATPVSGRVVVPGLPAGRWRAVWWDLTKGGPQPATEYAHAGGDFHLPTPPIGRHAAVSLERLP